jgi:hypothetical protein
MYFFPRAQMCESTKQWKKANFHTIQLCQWKAVKQMDKALSSKCPTREPNHGGMASIVLKVIKKVGYDS